MGKCLKLLACLVFLAAPAFGQNYRYDNIAFKSNGGFIANATVTVCTGIAVPLVACSTPTATLLAGPTGNTTSANPVTADANGNFGFYVAAGNYTYTVSAPGFGSYSVGITLAPPNAAVKPAASDAWLFLSAAGNDSNDCLSLGTPCLTPAHVISVATANAPNQNWHIVVTGKINVTTSGSPAAQLPIATKSSSCIIEGASAQDITGVNTLGTGGAIFDLTSGTGPIFDQTITNASFQNALGCQFKNLTFVDDPANASTNVILVKFGGTQGEKFDNVHFVGNGSSGEVCLEPFNATGMFTERAQYDVWLSDCTVGMKEVGTGTSRDLGYFEPSTFRFNQQAGQNGIELSDASIVNSDIVLSGNFVGAGGNVIINDDVNSGITFSHLVNIVEQDGTATRYNNTIGGAFSSILFNLGSGTWSDLGAINSQTIFTPTSQFQNNLTIGHQAILNSTGGGTITHQAPNTASNFTQTDTPLSGSTVVNITGSVSIASGFGTTPAIVNQGAGSGPTSVEVNVGTGGTATSGVLTLPAAPNGWSCPGINDMNTNIVTRETAFTTTSVTLTAASAWTASDKLLMTCWPF